MNGNNFQESPSRHKYIVPLMVLSLTFLIILQAAWLRSEYRSAANAFRRETNMVFRNTIIQIADSLFFAHFANNPDADTLIIRRDGDRLDRLEVRGMQRKERRVQGNGFGDTLMRDKDNRVTHPVDTSNYQVRIVKSHTSTPQTGRSEREGRRPSRHFRFFSNAAIRSISTDTIGMLYRQALHYRFRNLPIQIIQKQVNWMEMDWSRSNRPVSDTLRFATGFYPIGPKFVYAANFENVRRLLFIELLPQMGFSLITTGLIIGLFLLTVRYLKAQQRLINQKNDFIGNMTHELKTPVATVGVALEAMKNFDVLKNPLKAEEYIDMAMHELERLSLMTDKILKTSIYDYKTEIERNKTPIDLSILAERVYNSFRLIAEKNRIQFELKVTESVWVSGHFDHLLQMIYNLVDNAFKYSGNNTNIVMSVALSNGIAELKVSDTGPGIASEHHRKIFEKFYRVPSGNVHTVKGYGLGLCYVEGIAKSHGGKVSLESQPEKGSVFTVSLPAIEAHGKN